jgi:hypothetical protein
VAIWPMLLIPSTDVATSNCDDNLLHNHDLRLLPHLRAAIPVAGWKSRQVHGSDERHLNACIPNRFDFVSRKFGVGDYVVYG